MKGLKVFLLISIWMIPFFLVAKVPAKRASVVYYRNNRGNPVNVYNKNNRGDLTNIYYKNNRENPTNFYRNTRRWPTYYGYYGYPIVGSMYYYSFPMNNNFFDSYPSYFTDWTYPSYPYVGKYYINDAPIPASKLQSKSYRRGMSRANRPPSSSVIISTPQEGKTSGFFIND